MKLSRLKLWVVLLFAASFFVACNSDDKDPVQTQASNPTPDVPGDANAVLAAISVRANVPSSVPVPGIPDFLVDVGSANFFTGAIGGNRTSAGDVKLNDYALQNIGDSYVNNNTDIALGISPGQTNDWNVSGGNGFDAFTHTTSKKAPGIVKFSNVGDEISISGPITLSIAGVPSNCDNILWVVSDGKKTVTKESKTNSVTFSSSELSGIAATANGIVQVAAYNSESKSFGGKKVYFINETVDSKIVKLN